MRSRSLKPKLFDNEILGRADAIYTILFAGLWCAADREGRLEDRPARIKAQIFPYREDVDINACLSWLQVNDFIERYVVKGVAVIWIKTFLDHQRPHSKETPSKLPTKAVRSTNLGRGKHQSRQLLARSDSGLLTPDSLNLTPDSGLPIPDSLFPTAAPPPAALARPEPEPRPMNVLKNGFDPEADRNGVGGGAPKPIGDILASMKQRFKHA